MAQASGEILIDVHDLTKTYDGRTLAVDHLNLQVAAGQIYGFLGPNGAGKTTTIKAMVGLLRPDSGTVRLAGVDVVRNPLEAKRLVGYIPDTPAVYDRLTGIEYLNFIADVF
ncbi:MAG: ATP-binding cassette domain-containing protein, partial [Bacteroidota bacterium]